MKNVKTLPPNTDTAVPEIKSINQGTSKTTRNCSKCKGTGKSMTFNDFIIKCINCKGAGFVTINPELV